MLTMRGAPALSEFRLHKLRTQLADIAGSDVRLSARFVHFIDLDGTLSEAEMALLEQLLTYGPRRGDVSEAGRLLLVVPRPGTISPWSSKASDIAHNCGLQRIRRIERGIAYWVEGDMRGPGAYAALAARLHDRMTQAVVFALEEAEQLFETYNYLAPDQAVGLALFADPGDWRWSDLDDLCGQFPGRTDV